MPPFLPLKLLTLPFNPSLPLKIIFELRKDFRDSRDIGAEKSSNPRGVKF